MWDALYKDWPADQGGSEDDVRIRLPFVVPGRRAHPHRRGGRVPERDQGARLARVAARTWSTIRSPARCSAIRRHPARSPPRPEACDEHRRRRRPRARRARGPAALPRAVLAQVHHRSTAGSRTASCPTASRPPAGSTAPTPSSPDGRPGGSDLGLLREQVLDEYGIEQAILTGWLNASAMQEGWTEFKTALMSAYNDWAVENWIEKDERLFGSVHVNAWDAGGRRARDRPHGRAPADRAGDALHRRPGVRRSRATRRSSRRRRATTSSSASTTARTRRPRSAATATSPSGTRWCRRSSCRRP